MNVPRNPLGIRNKRIFLLLGVLLALLLPVLIYESWHGMEDLATVEEELASALRLRTHKQAYMAKVRNYQAFSSEIKQFLKNAREARILENDWVIYEVDIRDRLVSLGTMRTFLDNAQSSERYYFRPKMLQITSLFAEQLLSSDILKKLDETKKTSKAPFIDPQGESVVQKAQRKKSPVGRQVLMTLKGTYMVKKP